MRTGQRHSGSVEPSTDACRTVNSIAMSEMDASWSGEGEAVGEERREEGGMDKRHMV